MFYPISALPGTLKARLNAMISSQFSILYGSDSDTRGPASGDDTGASTVETQNVGSEGLCWDQIQLPTSRPMIDSSHSLCSHDNGTHKMASVLGGCTRILWVARAYVFGLDRDCGPSRSRPLNRKVRFAL
jgi:hypothetical protein